MKKLLTLALVALIALSASAQNSRRDRQTSANMTEIYKTQADDLIKTLKLKKDKKDMFTAMFLDWQAARFNAINPNGGDVESKEASLDFKNMTDEDAEKAVQDNFDRQVKQMEVDKEYYAKFKDFLTPVQAAQVMLSSRGGAAAMMGRMAGMMGGGFPMGGFGGGMPMGGGFGGGMPMGGFGGF